MNNKLKIGILGATGMVGQNFLKLLENHPWFEVVCLMASANSAGKKYQDLMQTKWKLESQIPDYAKNMVVQNCEIVPTGLDLVFSALDSAVATKIELLFAQSGVGVFSNSKNHRNHPDVPIIIPEINSEHFEAIKNQDFGGGFIVTNPNCSLQAMALPLFPIFEKFGLEKIMVTTLQAISGAGYPGVPSLDILGNVVPFIDGEEEKIETETKKIFSTWNGSKFVLPNIKISASCNRVPVINGHTASISFSTTKKITQQEILDLWQNWQPATIGLPSWQKPVIYTEIQNRPQPRLDSNLGMTVSIGRLRECQCLDYKITTVVNNTVRGAAGGAILNAELWASLLATKK